MKKLLLFDVDNTLTISRGKITGEMKCLLEKLKEKTPPMLGKKHSPKTIEKMKGDPRRKNSGEKNGMYGRTQSDEFKKNMSLKMSENNPMKGKTHSPEAKEKMRQAALNRYKNKTLFQLDSLTSVNTDSNLSSQTQEP